MLLSIPERILLLNVLPPAEGDFLFLRAVRTLRESLGFSEEEAADLKPKRDGERVTWDAAEAPMKEIALGPTMASYISKSILSAPALKEDHLDFYFRVVSEV